MDRLIIKEIRKCYILIITHLKNKRIFSFLLQYNEFDFYILICLVIIESDIIKKWQ
jgi:hypothetical protein